nr:unnamed protein product [Spirometra erinaceieuropaei]
MSTEHDTANPTTGSHTDGTEAHWSRLMRNMHNGGPVRPAEKARTGLKKEPRSLKQELYWPDVSDSCSNPSSDWIGYMSSNSDIYIVWYIVGHRVDPNEAFRVIYKVPSNYLKPLGQRPLATAEGAAIRLRKPILCAQKKHVQAPRLQWSKVD